MTKIGVFDSGVGGLSVARALQEGFPEDTIIFVNDREHMPYGDKPTLQVLNFVTPKLEQMVDAGCEVIVIACNTVTTTMISQLRKQTRIPLVGIEPMVKSAAEITKSGTIAVCATPATLASKRYAWLKDNYAKDVNVIEPDCSRWAYMIEHNDINAEQIRKQIDDLCKQGADVIVLGCTHYHWIEETIKEATRGRAKVVQPEQAIVARVKHVLDELKTTSSAD